MSVLSNGVYRDFSLSGDYRHIVTKPEDLCYQIKSYTSEDEKLVKSDLDLMENSQQGKR